MNQFPRTFNVKPVVQVVFIQKGNINIFVINGLKFLKQIEKNKPGWLQNIKGHLPPMNISLFVILRDSNFFF